MCGAALLATGVCGCTALPPALKLGTLALTGASYIVTGKGPSDHVISAIAEQDCALLRVVRDTPICVAYRPSSTAAVASRERSPAPATQARQPGKGQPTPPPQYYLVLGSFSAEGNAERWRRSLARFDTAIARAGPGPEHAPVRYRVVMGPYREEESLRRRKEVEEMLRQEVWRVRLCSATLSAPPCAAAAMVASR
jgi:hypothetical protein